MAYVFNPFTGNLDSYGPILTGTGTVSAAADGTAALPGIAFASDTNTGIYRPGADQLAISTGGTGRLFVNAAGTIQTAAAGQIETVSSTGTLTLYGGSTNKGGGIRLAGGNIDADIRFYAQQFTATPQERARIDVSGRLLVGTSSARTKYANIFQTETVSGQSNYGFTTVFNADTSNGASIALGKSRGTTAGSNAIVGANDNLGSVQFVGADGTDLESAASIDAFVDSTPAYAATALVNGQTYRIVTVGSTDFTLIGASANTVGTIFTATGPGTGTGTAILNAGNMPGRLVFSTTADGASSPTERMRITNGGNIRIGSALAYASEFFTVNNGGTLASEITAFGGSGGVNHKFYFHNGAAGNAAGTVYWTNANSTTGRSINAGGTINASGADYAEYMVKAGDFTINKGDICGVTSDGLLTLIYQESAGFLVKSTNPSYVGNDGWGAGYEDDTDGLELVRKTVDRIAFAGQVPVNVMGAVPGQYIVPTEAADGGIEGVAKNEADLTLAEYMRAVGKVIAIEDDGRARIIVKVA